MAVFLIIHIIKVLPIFQEPGVAHPLWLRAKTVAVSVEVGGGTGEPGVAQPLWLAVEAASQIVVVAEPVVVVLLLFFLWFLFLFELGIVVILVSGGSIVVVVSGVCGETLLFCERRGVIVNVIGIVVFRLGDVGDRVVILGEMFVEWLLRVGGGGRRELAGLVGVEAVAVFFIRDYEIGFLFFFLLLVVGELFGGWESVSGGSCGSRGRGRGGGDFVEELAISGMYSVKGG